MVDTCHVTGVVISPDGDPVPRATVRFQRLPHAVFVEDDKTGIPREVRAEADEEGNIAVDLIPGEYKVLIIARGYNQYPAFNVGVPDQPTAVLADIQDVPPPPSLDDATRAVRDAREARDESREARDEAAASAQAAADAAQGVEDHATAAAASAQAAADSETAAATSAGSAATSASNAAASATAASDSASAAATSASAAADSASAASTSASNADDARQAAEAAAQTATEKAGEAADSAQNAADAAAAIPALLIGPSVMARYNPSRLVVYDNCVRNVSEPTDAYGLQTPSGHTWEGVPRDDGEGGLVNPILRYTPQGTLYATRAPYGSTTSDTPFSLISDTPWHEYKTVFAKFNDIITPTWMRGIVLNWIDEDNWLYVEVTNWNCRLHAIVGGVETSLGSFGNLNTGSSFNYPATEVSARIFRTHTNFSPSARGVLIHANGESERFPIPLEYEHLVKNPGKIGLIVSRDTHFTTFGMEAN